MTNSPHNLAPPLEFRLPNWDDRWSAEKLQHVYQKIGPTAFDRGYRQKPKTITDLFFPHFRQNIIYFYDEDWRAISNPDHPSYNPSHPAYVDPDWDIYVGVDLSGAKRRGNVIFVLAQGPNNMRKCLDVRMGAWEAPQTAREIDKVAREYQPKLIFVENNAYQTAIIEFITDMDLHAAPLVQGFKTGSNKLNPEIGLPSLDVQFSQQLWRLSIPHGEHDIVEHGSGHGIQGCACGRCSFVRDVLDYTGMEKTPDTIMACFIAKEASRLSGGVWTQDSVAISRMDTADAMSKIANHKKSVLRIPAGTSNNPFKRKAQTDDWGRPIR